MFSRLRTEWILDDEPTDAEFEALDENMSNMLDGYEGGTYAPSAQIVLGGAGLKCLDAFEITHSAELLSASVSGDLTVGGNVTLNGAILNIFNSNPSLHGETTVTGTLRVDGAAGFHDLVTCDGDQSWDLDTGKDLGISATGTGKMSCSAPSTWSARAQLASDGQIARRIVTGSISSRTYSVEVADEVLVPATVNSGCTYTLVNNSAKAGSRIRFSRIVTDGDDPNAEANLTNALNIKANTGGALILKSLGDASGNLRFIELVFDGTNWFICSWEKVPLCSRESAHHSDGPIFLSYCQRSLKPLMLARAKRSMGTVAGRTPPRPSWSLVELASKLPARFALNPLLHSRTT